MFCRRDTFNPLVAHLRACDRTCNPLRVPSPPTSRDQCDGVTCVQIALIAYCYQSGPVLPMGARGGNLITAHFATLSPRCLVRSTSSYGIDGENMWHRRRIYTASAARNHIFRRYQAAARVDAPGARAPRHPQSIGATRKCRPMSPCVSTSLFLIGNAQPSARLLDKPADDHGRDGEQSWTW